MLNIPDRVRIRGEYWKVDFQDLKNTLDCYGICYTDSRTIIIDESLTPSETLVIFLHEVLHALWPEDIISLEIEEELVHHLSAWLPSTLRSVGVIDSITAQKKPSG